MKLKVIAGFVSLLCLQTAYAEPLKTLEEKYSYSLGYTIGNNIKLKYKSADQKILLKALQDAFNEAKPALTDQQMLQAFQAMEMKRKAGEMEVAKVNLEKGKAFIKQYRAGKGVKPLSGGLYYKVIKSGKGTSPRANQKVRVHYEGKLINGKVFDSSYKRGAPAEFKLNEVIQGWTLAVQAMQPGDKWEVVIPSGMAYGPRGAGGSIGPNETLIFTIELIKVL